MLINNELLLFHGTNKLFDNIDLNKSKDKRDFGKGFYTLYVDGIYKQVPTKGSGTCNKLPGTSTARKNQARDKSFTMLSAI
jgi:hypothetical protein